MQLHHLYNCLRRHFTGEIELLEDGIKISEVNNLLSCDIRSLVDDYQDSPGEFYINFMGDRNIFITENKIKPVGMD
jgi:hypothetical protein